MPFNSLNVQSCRKFVSFYVCSFALSFKVHYLTETDVTFLLTSVGHNAGIVSEPGHPHRHFRIATRTRDDVSLGPDEWVKAASQRRGSWWTSWAEWLAAHSAAERVMPPAMGRVEKGFAPLYDAPGAYVLQR